MTKKQLRAGTALLLLVAAAVPAFSACDGGPSAPYERRLTSTVAVGNASRVVVEAWTPIAIAGAASRTDIFVELEATVTASSSTVARQLAEKLEIEVERPSAGDVVIRIRPPESGTLEGVMRVEMPSRLAMGATAHQGTIAAGGIEGAIQVAAQSGVTIERAKGKVAAVVNQGAILIDSELTPGAGVSAEVGSGDIVLALPSRVSAAVAADIGQQGEVVVAHPQLPPAVGPGRTRYRAEVSGGLSPIQLLTQAGRITIGVRQEGP